MCNSFTIFQVSKPKDRKITIAMSGKSNFYEYCYEVSKISTLIPECYTVMNSSLVTRTFLWENTGRRRNTE